MKVTDFDRLLSLASDKELFPIIDKVLKRERLSFEDGVKLFKTSDLITLGLLANYVTEKRTVNMHILL